MTNALRPLVVVHASLVREVNEATRVFLRGRPSERSIAHVIAEVGKNPLHVIVAGEAMRMLRAELASRRAS